MTPEMLEARIAQLEMQLAILVGFIALEMTDTNGSHVIHRLTDGKWWREYQQREGQNILSQIGLTLRGEA